MHKSRKAAAHDRERIQAIDNERKQKRRETFRAAMRHAGKSPHEIERLILLLDEREREIARGR
jgi:hypothetical protein